MATRTTIHRAANAASVPDCGKYPHASAAKHPRGERNSYWTDDPRRVTCKLCKRVAKADTKTRTPRPRKRPRRRPFWLTDFERALMNVSPKTLRELGADLAAVIDDIEDANDALERATDNIVAKLKTLQRVEPHVHLALVQALTRTTLDDDGRADALADLIDAEEERRGDRD